MNEKIKLRKIINLIVIIAVAIIGFAVVKNIPSLLIGKESIKTSQEIQTITKVNEEVQSLAPDSKFDTAGEVGYLQKITTAGSSYYRVVADSVAQQIYCAAKGFKLNNKGDSYEDVKAFADGLIGQESGWHNPLEHHPYIEEQDYISRV